MIAKLFALFCMLALANAVGKTYVKYFEWEPSKLASLKIGESIIAHIIPRKILTDDHDLGAQLAMDIARGPIPLFHIFAAQNQAEYMMTNNKVTLDLMQDCKGNKPVCDSFLFFQMRQKGYKNNPKSQTIVNDYYPKSNGAEPTFGKEEDLNFEFELNEPYRVEFKLVAKNKFDVLIDDKYITTHTYGGTESMDDGFVIKMSGYFNAVIYYVSLNLNGLTRNWRRIGTGSVTISNLFY